MTNRKELEEKILSEMRKIKSKLDQPSENDDPNTVPYDKEAARSVIQKFLNDHPEKERFLKDLKEKMDQ